MNARRVFNRFIPLAIVALAGVVIPASAQTPPLLRLSDGTNVITVDSNGSIFRTGCSAVACPGTALVTSLPSAGTIHFTGSIGNFTVTDAAGQPNAGGIADLGVGTIHATTAGQLTVSLTETNVAVSGPLSFKVLSHGGGSTNSVYIDPNNVPFGGTSGTPVCSVAASGTQDVLAGTCTSFTATTGASSLTLQAVMQVPVGGSDGIPFTDDLTFFASSITPVPLKVTCSANTGTYGMPYSSSVSATGGLPPYKYSISAGMLPPTLSLDATSGVISGTITGTGPYSFTVQALDSGTGFAQSRGTSSCGITIPVPPIMSNCVAITTVQGSPITPVQLTATGGTGGYTFASSNLPAGLVISSLGVISGTPTVSGTNIPYTVTITDKSGNKGTLYCSVSVTPTPAATCVSITAVQNVAIATVTLVGSGGAGGPYTFTATGLPTGLSIALNGTISGTPTVTGTFPYTVTIKDSKGNMGKLNCSVTVSSPCLTLMCPKSSGFVGQTYSSWLVASGGKPGYTYSIVSGSLPPGLTLVASTGAITGKPTAEGTFTFTSKAVDSGIGSAQNVITSTCYITITKCGTSLVSTNNNWNSSNKWNQWSWGWGGWGDNSGKSSPITWFNCHINKLGGTIPTTTFSIYISGGKISFGGQSVNVPDGVITFSTSQTSEQTVFNAALNRWETTLPISDASKADEIFAAGLAYQMPSNQTFNNITWSANVTSSAPNVYVTWQFGASNWLPSNYGASFPTLSTSSFKPDYNGLKVHPCHNGTSQNNYNNWGWGGWGDNNSSDDHAGSPEFSNRQNCLIDGGTESGDSDWVGCGKWNTPPPAVCACQEPNTPSDKGDAGSISFWGGNNGQNLIKGLNGGNRSTTLCNWLADNFPSTYGSKCNNDLHGKSNDDLAAICQNNSKQGSSADNEHLACALSAYVTNTTLCGKKAPEYQNNCPVNGGGGGTGDDGKGYGFNCTPDGSSSKYCDVHQTGWSCSNLGFHDEEPKTVIQLLQQCDSAKGSGSYNSNAYHDVFNKINSSGGIWQ